MDGSLAAALEHEVERSVERDMPRVRQLPTPTRMVPANAIQSEEALRRFHRAKVVDTRVAAEVSKRKSKGEIERLEADRKRITAVYRADMKSLAEMIEAEKAKDADEQAAAERIIAASRAALGELAAE